MGLLARLPARIARTLDFLATVERLKLVGRRVNVSGNGRPESSAEHSWHAALMAMLLAPEFPRGVDSDRVIRMLLVHDLVEVYAGDTFFFDNGSAKASQKAREARAAKRLFSQLDGRAGREVRSLWREYEGFRTPEARYAKAIDMLQPMIQNICADGECWKSNRVRLEDIRERKKGRMRHDPKVWAIFEHLLGIAEKRNLTWRGD